MKRLAFLLAGVVLGLGTLAAQTAAPAANPSAYTLGFSTYLFHTDKYAARFSIVTDDAGFLYVSGTTRDRNFPATPGAYQSALKGEADAFVVKLTPEGKIVFATLIGGSKREHHTGILVDKQGFIYLVGGTHSADFPVTPGAYDTSFNGEGEWAGDVYVAKINPTGSGLVFATFLGGKVEETANQIGLDSKGNIVVAGCTCSADFPATAGVIDDKYTKQDVFLAKISARGDKLLFATSLGKGVYETVTGLAIDDHDQIYAAGFTFAADLPTTADAVRKTTIKPTAPGNEGGSDHFLAKINETGTKILYLSYFAAGGDLGVNLDWTGPDRLLMTGSVNEDGFPITDRAMGAKSAGGKDAFVSVFNSDDMTLAYSARIGGKDGERIFSGRFLDRDTVVIGGITSSPDYPMTEDALFKEFPVWEKTFNSSFFGRRKASVSVIDLKNNRLLYSTYLGGCFQFQLYPDKAGAISFIAEAGQREAFGTTGFPVAGEGAEEPPTYLMLGRLVPGKSSGSK